MKRELVVLSGRVQGVGFRETVVAIAQRFDVAGTVRNERDGRRLTIDVEGEAEIVDAFVRSVLAEPPRFARIEQLERTAALPRGMLGFRREAT